MKIARKTFIVAAIACILLASGCSRIKQIKLLGFSVESVAPSGLRSLDAVLALHIENPAMQFQLTDLNGVLYYKGKDFANYSSEDITVKGKTTGVYDLPCSANLADGVSLMQVLSLIKDYDIEDFTTDASVRVTLKKGLSKVLKFEDVPIKDLME